MQLRVEEVNQIANLARLSLSQDEQSRFTPELSEILNYVESLSNVRLEKGDFYHMSGLTNILKKDQVEPSLSVEQTLKNSPAKEGSYLKVQAVFNDERN